MRLQNNKKVVTSDAARYYFFALLKIAVHTLLAHVDAAHTA